jgi:predicted flap endonuclease-1-like 5' DNA nuclease
MNSELEDKVNEAIEFFPGRVKRDEWPKQARKFVDLVAEEGGS